MGMVSEVVLFVKLPAAKQGKNKKEHKQHSTHLCNLVFIGLDLMGRIK